MRHSTDEFAYLTHCPLPVPPVDYALPLHRQQDRFLIIKVERRRDVADRDWWYVHDRYAPHLFDECVPLNGFPTRRECVEWITDYLNANSAVFDEMRAMWYERRRSARAEARRDEFEGEDDQ